MSDYDVMVIGAGPGGYVTAIRAAQLGLSVALIEKEYLGGVCLNIGCIPTKSLLKNAELASLLRNEADEFGIHFDSLELDYSAAVKRSRVVSEKLVSGVEFLLKKYKVELIWGRAEFEGPKTLQVTSEGSAQSLTADHIIIATGANPFILPGVEADGSRVYTYEKAILDETLPDSVLIVGAGAIGMEFATIWNSYGVPVTVVEMERTLLPREDEQVSRELARAVKDRGIQVHLRSTVQKVDQQKKKVKVHLETPQGEEVISVDEVLLAASFVPNSQDLGLEKAGVETDTKGFIQIDERMATNVPGVWAVGDVTGKLMLAHVGMEMGIVCAEQIAGVPTPSLDYRMMPRATFCSPQVASFGFTEREAKEQGYEVSTGRFNFRANGKALGMNDPRGFVKIVIDTKYGEILGAHLIGPEVTELLGELSLAREMELTPEEIARTVHAHPTLSEAVVEAAKAAQGQAIHA